MVELTGKNFEKEVLQSRIPVLVDFYADWCGPCQIARPILEELEKEYLNKVKFGKLDVDASPAIAGEYRVMSIPMVMVFKKGKEVGRQVGFSEKEGIVGLIREGLR